MPKFFVCNDKGGTGKSTIAMQILASFNHHLTNNKSNYFEYDLKNKDSAGFVNSKIVSINYANDDHDLIYLLDQFRRAPHAVMDIGGNLSTSIFLKEIKISDGFKKVDAVVIPFGKGDQDSLNALKIYQSIRAFSDVKIIFAANMYEMPLDSDNYDFGYICKQFPMFFGDKTARGATKTGIIEHIDKKDRLFIAVPYFELFNWARSFNMTLYEIAITADKRIQDTEEKIEKCYAENKMDEYESYVIHSYNLRKAKFFLIDELAQIWKSLNEILLEKQHA